MRNEFNSNIKYLSVEAALAAMTTNGVDHDAVKMIKSESASLAALTRFGAAQVYVPPINNCPMVSGKVFVPCLVEFTVDKEFEHFLLGLMFRSGIDQVECEQEELAA